MDKRYYLPNMPIENPNANMLRSLGEISEETASDHTSERGMTFRSKQLMDHRNKHKLTLTSPPRLSKLHTTDKIKSPKIQRVFKLPTIINSQRKVQKEKDDEIGVFSEAEYESDDSKGLMSKLLSIDTIPKEKRSLLDWHISDPNRYKNKDIELIRDNAYERYSMKCKELKIVPVRFSLNYDKPQSKHVKAKNYLMGEAHIEAFNEALSVMPKIQSLNLSNNKLGGKGAKGLLKSTDYLKPKK
jgi:hypothetical protein